MMPDQEIAAARTRVSILARIIPALSYALPALGAALSALLFINVMRAMRNAEAAGIAAIAGGMSEANIAIVATLYLAIFVGLIGAIVSIVRALSTTSTAAPAGWLFLVMGVLGIAPVLTLWQAQSLLLNVLTSPGSGPGVAVVAQDITIYIYSTLGLAPVVCLVLLVLSLIPLPAVLRARWKWSPVIALLILELMMVGMTVAYHMRTYWFYQARINERF